MMKFMSPFQPINGVVDFKNNMHYGNLFYAQINIEYSNLFGLGYGKFKVRASETTWPSKGDEDEIYATHLRKRIRTL